MYVNKIGMAIKADQVVIRLTIEEFEALATTVIQRQLGQSEVYVGGSVSTEDGLIYIAIDENDPETLEKLNKLGYRTENDTWNADIVFPLIFDTQNVSYEYDYDDEVILIFLSFQEYIEKTFEF